MGLQRMLKRCDLSAPAFRTGMNGPGVPKRRTRGTVVARSILSGGTKARSELGYPRERVAK